MRAGTALRAAELGVLASVGCAMVPVIPPVRVAIVTTGNELADVQDTLGPGAIRDSNSYALSAQARMAGATVVMFPRVRDDTDAVREALEAAVEQADIVITNGGVSVGDYDYVKLTLEQMGADLKFWRVNQKPGKPLAFWMLRGRPVASLPGYPVSAMVCFEEYVRPALRKMMGHSLLHRPWRNAALEGGYQKKGDRRVHIVRVHAWEEDGRWKARLTGPQGSGILSSMANANALGQIEAGDDEVADGGLIQIHLTDQPEEH
jgi:molybdopterin molybdotransferase